MRESVKRGDPSHCTRKRWEVFLFADYVKFHANKTGTMSKVLEASDNRGKLYGMKRAPTKCPVILDISRQKETPLLRSENEQISITEAATSLGVTVTSYGVRDNAIKQTMEHALDSTITLKR